MSCKQLGFISPSLPSGQASPKCGTEISTGTTLFACQYDGGVVIAADSRTSSGSGSAADTQAVADIVRYQLDYHRFTMDREPKISEAAKISSDICYRYRDSLTAGLIVAGYDDSDGPQIYSIPLGGMLIKQNCAIGGSGSTYLYGYIDREFKPTLSKEDCVKFVSNGVALAIGRDGSSGGCVRVAIISKDGVERRLIKGDSVPVFYDQKAPQ